MYFKKMVGKKCYLSPMNEDDAVKFTEWLNDLNITSNLAFFHQNINIEKEKMLLNSISKEHHYSIIDNNSNDLIGSCGLQRIDHLNQTASIGIIIGNKNYWNKGYGTEALTLLIDYGFKALNLHNIFLSVFEFNERAIKCYEKVGFKEIGRRRKCLYRNLKRYDLIYMDILVNEFYENNKIILESIEIKELLLQDINNSILDLFDRYQKVEKQWCNKNGNWTLINKGYIIDWDKDKKEGKIQQLLVILKNKSGNVFGAYKNNNLIGFSVILNDKFGTNTQYVKLKLLYVSNGYRHKGIGKRLFKKCVEKAKEMNAEKIYICANNSEETQGFYLSMGCKDAMEIDDKSYDAERFERHLEYIIK